MNILLITLRADIGGGPEHIYQLVRYADENKQFFVACPQERPYWERFHDVLRGRLAEIPHQQFSFDALSRLSRFIRDNRIDIIHAHGKGAGLYGRFLSSVTKAPCIFTPHGIHVGEYGRAKKQLYFFYENVSSRWISKIFFVSPSEAIQAKEMRLWRKVSSHVVPNGVENKDVAKMRILRGEQRDRLHLSEEHIVVATTTRFNYQKNMEEAFHIAEQLSHITFAWIGDGQERRSLEQRAYEHKVRNIIFTGFVEYPDPYLAAADIYLSTSRWEGMPLGILEAMATGLPVVATNVVGNRDLVIDGATGFLYFLGDTRTGTEKILALASNNELRKRLGSTGLVLQRQKHSSQIMARQICNVYENIIERNKKFIHF